GPHGLRAPGARRAHRRPAGRVDRTGHRARLPGAGELCRAPLPAGHPQRGVGAPPLRRTRPRPADIPITLLNRREQCDPEECFRYAQLSMRLNEKSFVAQCVTCGSELHPERAEKYDYCMAPECQEKNLKSLTMVAVGVNKSAEQYLLLNEETKDELARGKFHDQRRGSFGTSVPSPAGG